MSLVEQAGDIVEGWTNVAKGKNKLLAEFRLRCCKTSGPNGGACPFFNQVLQSCAKQCFCPMVAKGTLNKTSCPLGKW